MHIEKRPWGYYVVIFKNFTVKIKKLVIEPHQRISYQYHNQRSEHWFVVQGSAKVTINDKIFNLEIGESVDILCGDRHRVANTGPDNLVIIEIQTGTYFGEDDIVRIDDDYGR